MPAFASVASVVSAKFPPSHDARLIGYDQQIFSDHKTRFETVDMIRKASGATMGVPAQWQVYPNSWIKLTRERQLWLMDLFCVAAYGLRFTQLSGTPKADAISEWRSTMHGGRCFTNRRGWNNGYLDYVQGLNIGASPMEWEPLVLSGNLVEVIAGPETFTTQVFERQGRYKFYRVRAIDSTKLPSVYEVIADRFICHQATTIRPDGLTGIFPQFGGQLVVPLFEPAPNKAFPAGCWIWEGLLQ